MESVSSSFKTERAKRETDRPGREARANVFDYIERFYNPKRNHTINGYISPMTFEGRDMKAWIAILETAIGPPADLAIDLEWRQDNPGPLIKPLKTSGNGLHKDRGGNRADLLETFVGHAGASCNHPDALHRSRKDRCGDARKGQHVQREDQLQTPETANNGGVMIDIPIHPELRRVLDALPADQFTFLETRAGKDRSPTGFGTAMHAWCDQAERPNGPSHGLRKAIA